MIPIILLALTVVFVGYGGSDRVAGWLLPSWPLPLAQGTLIGGMILVTTLLIPATRFLGQSLIVGSAKVVFRVLLAVGVALLSGGRAIGLTVIHAVRALTQSNST